MVPFSQTWLERTELKRVVQTIKWMPVVVTVAVALIMATRLLTTGSFWGATPSEASAKQAVQAESTPIE